MSYSALQQLDADTNKRAAAFAAPATEIVVSSEPVDRAWDDFLAATPGGHHVQTTAWSRLKATLGWRAVRVIAKERGHIVGGVQILVREYGKRFRIGYISKGPLFASTNQTLASALLRAYHDEAQAQRLHCTIVQPPEKSALTAELEGHGYHPVRFATLLQATTVIDLSASLDDILMHMKRKTRRNVRQSQRSGLHVRRGTAADLDAFYDAFTSTADRKGFRDYSKSYFEQLWELFAPGDHIQLFIAEKDGRPVSASLRLAFGDTVVCKKRGWTGEFASLRPNEAVEWAAIQWAKEAGYRYYDFEGLPRAMAEAVVRGQPLPEENVQSPASYKLGFGGEVRILPDSLARFSNPLLRWGHRVVYPKVANWRLIDRLVHRIKVN